MESDDGILLAVVEANCRYLAPARYDDEVRRPHQIEEATRAWSASAMSCFPPRDGRRLATGFTKHIFCGRDRRAAKLPEKYRPLFGISAEPARIE